MIIADDIGNDRHFQRRLAAAVAGVHLPSEEELLRGMSFFKDRLIEDIREYASRLGRAAKKRATLGPASILACLDELAVDPCLEAVTVLEDVIAEVEDAKRFPVAACRLRCRIYRAWFGEEDAMAQVAAEAAARAFDDGRYDRLPELTWDALAWGALSVRIAGWKDTGVAIATSHTRTDHELQRTRQQFRRAFQRAVERELEERLAESDVKKAEQKDEDFGLGSETSDSDIDDESVPSPRPSIDGVMILTGIGNETTSEGKKVVKEFASLIGKPVPLRAPPDLSLAREELIAEFPYAAGIVDALLKTMIGRDHVWLRPTLLVGSPGCGKTRFARRFAEVVGLPYELVPCGGLSDSAIGGTARRWSSGEPSIPIMSIRRHGVANPCVILDEIEKVGTNRNNGNPHDVLIGLLENETAQRWHDPYVESHCNLSFVVWLMTANSVGPIPSVLRDRCRFIRFPDPGPDDLDMLAHRILQRLYEDTGHDRRWATPLDGVERAALGEAWPGGSIRRLERLVEGLIAARDQSQVQQ
ncbi:AAA family ATPase [Aliihoeflea sp. 2WW]|uniref:AAA family ATPase n=1 Tax=Aliihoeflea sp. 2WW TaxID=1381123 RepID=UPI000464C50B|nr:AAA family ATPase [Aliihoeflea sp. 2WW]